MRLRVTNVERDSGPHLEGLPRETQVCLLSLTSLLQCTTATLVEGSDTCLATVCKARSATTSRTERMRLRVTNVEREVKDGADVTASDTCRA